MTNKNLSWYAAQRDEIPEIAYGDSSYRAKSVKDLQVAFRDADVKVAYAEDGFGSLDYQPPSIFVLRGSSAAETLSWIRVYARPAFPLSQFGRVMTDTDWEIFSQSDEDGQAFRTDKWACVIIGEMLAQTEHEGELDTLPVSRAASCFTTAIARAVFIHDSYSVSRVCTDRLREVSRDSRFSLRLIGVDSLVAIWGALGANIGDVTDMRQLADLFIDSAELALDRPQVVALRETFAEAKELFSDSVEERVVAFQRVAHRLDMGGAGGVSRSISQAYAAAVLALSAFLVGRGTSHSFLLKKWPLVAPMAYVWFGFAASLRGARGWDTAWARLTKAVERQVRSSFNWIDPPAADICWTEYKWLTSTFSGGQGLADIVRATPRALSVEIVPGAVCQLRMSEPVLRPKIGGTISAGSSPASAVGSDGELRAVLAAYVALSSKAKQLLDQKSDGPQSSLDLDSPPTPTRARAKRGDKKSQK